MIFVYCAKALVWFIIAGFVFQSTGEIEWSFFRDGGMAQVAMLLIRVVALVALIMGLDEVGNGFREIERIDRPSDGQNKEILHDGSRD